MKHYLTLLLLLISHLALSQSVKERAYSKIYLKGTYLNEQNEIIGLQTRTDLTDTLIDNTKFRKFEMSDFKDYTDQKQIKSYYESFSNGIYCLLDSSLQVVHQINFQTTNEQTGILFGKSTQIALELLHASGNHSDEAPVLTDNTPRKYFQKDAADIYVVIIPFFEALVVAGNGQFYVKKLMADCYNNISEGLLNDLKVSNRFDIQVGDEVQLFYRNKWYDDTTYLAEYRDKQFKSFKYSGDTIVQDKLQMKFQTEGYNYLSGSMDGSNEFLVPLTKDSYTMGSMFVPFQEYQTQMKLIETQNGPGLFLQGVTFDTVGTFIYPRIVQVKSEENGMLWKTNILPFFPLVFIETGNVEGFITYTKINGVESGIKRTRTFITDRDNIREISNNKSFEVNLEIYFIAPADIRIEIRDPDSEKVLVKQQSKANEGINTFVLASKKLKSANTYEVHITYQRPNGSGSFSNSVRIKY